MYSDVGTSYTHDVFQNYSDAFELKPIARARISAPGKAVSQGDKPDGYLESPVDSKKILWEQKTQAFEYLHSYRNAEDYVLSPHVPITHHMARARREQDLA